MREPRLLLVCTAVNKLYTALLLGVEAAKQGVKVDLVCMGTSVTGLTADGVDLVEPLPGHPAPLEMLRELRRLGCRVYACKLALEALGHDEEDLVEGVELTNPADIVRMVMEYGRVLSL